MILGNVRHKYIKLQQSSEDKLNMKTSERKKNILTMSEYHYIAIFVIVKLATFTTKI